MKDISGFATSLNSYLNWNKARVTCFVSMLLGLFSVKTVNLKEIALSMNGKANVNSRYRRLQRFFALFKIDFTQIAKWIFSLYILSGQEFYLVMDRTNWFWGKNKINIFMIGIAHEGMVIPLFWEILPKAGSSNLMEQKKLLMNFIKTFGINGLKGLLADREFASGKLFKWLNKKNIPFYIRIKEGSLLNIRNKKFCKAKKLFNHLNANEKYEFAMNVKLFGANVFLAGSRSERGELMILATNRCPKNAITIYLRRWEIESLFQGLKGRGFHFEATHITQLDRIAKLTALLAIAFAWAHRVGEWKSIKKPIIWKQFLNQKRPESSYFRYGLDHIREIILHNKGIRLLKEVFNLILPPLEIIL
jgi:DDE family transposase